MKNIYHIHQSSNSYWNNEWYDTDYYECDSMEEYNSLFEKYKEKWRTIEDDFKSTNNPSWNAKWKYENFRLIGEGKIHASEYYYGHEWQGKTFDAIGFGWFERLERSTHTYYYIKPGTLGKITECTDAGIGWMYGS